MAIRTFGTFFFAVAPTGDTFVDYMQSKNNLIWSRYGELLGTNASDSSGNGNNGTYEGDFTLNQTGLVSGDSDPAVLLVSPDGQVNYGNVSDLSTLGTTGYNIRIAEEFS